MSNDIRFAGCREDKLFEAGKPDLTLGTWQGSSGILNFVRLNTDYMNAADAGKLRLDKYLWSIRVFKTRSQAAEACEKGRVKMNGESVKAGRTVKQGDVYDIKTEARPWLIQVTGLLHTRQAYAEAVRFYQDLTPPEALLPAQKQAESFHTGKRLSKIGRPTKKQRRSLDDLLNEG